MAKVSQVRTVKTKKIFLTVILAFCDTKIKEITSLKDNIETFFHHFMWRPCISIYISSKQTFFYNFSENWQLKLCFLWPWLFPAGHLSFVNIILNIFFDKAFQTNQVIRKLMKLKGLGSYQDDKKKVRLNFFFWKFFVCSEVEFFCLISSQV